MKHSKTQNTDWNSLLSKIPESVAGVFHSDTDGKSDWKQLLAFDPVATLIIEDISDLKDLHKFLNQNKAHLCAGFLSYDLGLELKGIKSVHRSRHPLVVFQAYDSWVENGQTDLHVHSTSAEYHRQIETILAKPASKPRRASNSTFVPSLEQEAYKAGINRIHKYIRAGDFYQLNFTQQLISQTESTPRALFDQVRSRHPAAYAAYFEFEEMMVHSLSPELFLHHDAGVLTTEPIKGTRPRASDAQQDEIQRNELLESEKEQAELFMITDLLRNDLGEVSEIGSVSLDAVKEIRKLPRVWHTYSRISSQISSSYEPLDALLAMFPGGSITGCPKKRAMEVIDELEVSSRGIYTGSIGYFLPGGEFCFNIAIRTLIQQGPELSLGSGGGITIDSKWDDEWEELLIKATTFT